jgi:hypothetical protein
MIPLTFRLSAHCKVLPGPTSRIVGPLGLYQDPSRRLFSRHACCFTVQEMLNHPSSKTGHPLPRRTSPANSVTLRHHRLAQDASIKAGQGSGPAVKTTKTGSPRRNSSGDSHETGQSDPNTWFDQSNQNPTATFDSNVMEGKSQC